MENIKLLHHTILKLLTKVYHNMCWIITKNVIENLLTSVKLIKLHKISDEHYSINSVNGNFQDIIPFNFLWTDALISGFMVYKINANINCNTNQHIAKIIDPKFCIKFDEFNPIASKFSFIGAVSVNTKNFW